MNQPRELSLVHTTRTRHFSIDGGMRGRICIDAETYYVLRSIRALGGLVASLWALKVRALAENAVDDGTA